MTAIGIVKSSVEEAPAGEIFAAITAVTNDAAVSGGAIQKLVSEDAYAGFTTKLRAIQDKALETLSAGGQTSARVTSIKEVAIGKIQKLLLDAMKQSPGINEALQRAAASIKGATDDPTVKELVADHKSQFAQAAHARKAATEKEVDALADRIFDMSC
ncbi:MAG TPA: hypothetical protein VN457_06165 [Chlamydiales bacterium]|nr:hypothetical protein [Chlamydiales bacterium]